MSRTPTELNQNWCVVEQNRKGAQRVPHGESPTGYILFRVLFAELYSIRSG